MLKSKLIDQPRAQTVMQPGVRTKSIFHNPNISFTVDLENPLDVSLPARKDLFQDLKEDEVMDASKDSAPGKSIFDLAQSKANSKSTSPKAVPEASDQRAGATKSIGIQPISKTRTLRPSLLAKRTTGESSMNMNNLQLRKQSLTAGLPRNGRSSTYIRLSAKQSCSLGDQPSSALPWADQVALTRELQELIKCTSLAVASQDPEFFADANSQPLNEPLSATKSLGLRNRASLTPTLLPITNNQVSIVN